MFEINRAGAFLLLLVSTFWLVSSIHAQPTYVSHSFSRPNNASDNANYENNLTALLDSLSSKASLYNFYNDSANQIYSLYLCRGDVNATTCQNCVRTASQEVQQQCQSNRTAIIWYDECKLRYSSENFFGIAATSPYFLLWNTRNNSSPDERDVGGLAFIYTLVSKAPNWENMFGTDVAEAMNNASQNIYGLVQCTRDISNDECRSCLLQQIEEIEGCCQGKIGWNIVGPSCNMRYEQYLFYQQPLAPSTPASQPMPDDNPGELNVIITDYFGFW